MIIRKTGSFKSRPQPEEYFRPRPTHKHTHTSAHTSVLLSSTGPAIVKMCLSLCSAWVVRLFVSSFLPRVGQHRRFFEFVRARHSTVREKDQLCLFDDGYLNDYTIGFQLGSFLILSLFCEKTKQSRVIGRNLLWISSNRSSESSTYIFSIYVFFVVGGVVVVVVARSASIYIGRLAGARSRTRKKLNLSHTVIQSNKNLLLIQPSPRQPDLSARFSFLSFVRSLRVQSFVSAPRLTLALTGQIVGSSPAKRRQHEDGRVQLFVVVLVDGGVSGPANFRPIKEREEYLIFLNYLKKKLFIKR